MKKIAVLTLSAAILLVSCDAYNNSNKTQRGAVIGAAGGALLGAIFPASPRSTLAIVSLFLSLRKTT